MLEELAAPIFFGLFIPIIIYGAAKDSGVNMATVGQVMNSILMLISFIAAWFAYKSFMLSLDISEGNISFLGAEVIDKKKGITFNNVGPPHNDLYYCKYSIKNIGKRRIRILKIKTGYIEQSGKGFIQSQVDDVTENLDYTYPGVEVDYKFEISNQEFPKEWSLVCVMKVLYIDSMDKKKSEVFFMKFSNGSFCMITSKDYRDIMEYLPECFRHKTHNDFMSKI